jgi:hypothetical protein
MSLGCLGGPTSLVLECLSRDFGLAELTQTPRSSIAKRTGITDPNNGVGGMCKDYAELSVSPRGLERGV